MNPVCFSEVSVPAVNAGISVSRVGGNAQIKAMKKYAGSLRMDLAQYRELEAFAKFGSDLDKATQQQLNRGQRLVEILKQDQYKPLPVEKQITILALGVKGMLDSIPITQIVRAEAEFHQFMESNYDDILKEIREKKTIDEALDSRLTEACNEFLKTFVVE